MQGIIVIDKPVGFTSQDTVSKVKKLLNEKKAGHAGTLDPMATGVLPIMLGNYTKFSKYLIEHDKIYTAKVRLGQKTTTGDSEGEIIEEKPIKEYKDSYLRKIVRTCIGKQLQTPPMYSAVKVKGKKLYEYARDGVEVEVAPREIEIYDIEYSDYNQETKELKFIVSCSKGTYIRVLCEDIAEKLGTVGYMSELRRVKVDMFDLDEAVKLNVLEKFKDDSEFIESKILGIDSVFPRMTRILLPEQKLEAFLNGVKLKTQKEDGVYIVCNSYGIRLGTGVVKDKLLKRDVIIIN